MLHYTLVYYLVFMVHRSVAGITYVKKCFPERVKKQHSKNEAILS